MSEAKDEYVDRLTREMIEARKRQLEWMASGEPVPRPLGNLTIDQEMALCDLALQSLSQEAVRDEALAEWLDLPALMRERIVDALVPTVDADGCYEPEEIYEAIRCITSDHALKREPNAAAEGDDDVRR